MLNRNSTSVNLPVKLLVTIIFITLVSVVSKRYGFHREPHLVAHSSVQQPILLETRVPLIHVETRVPFLMYDNAVIVVAIINGKPTKCQIDTGAQQIMWNAERNLTDQRTGSEMLVGDAGGHKVRLQEAILDNVQIGGLKLSHVRSYVIPSGHENPNTVPALGNSVFADTVLTIDYARQELIIQPSAPNTVPPSVLDRRHVLNFRWINPTVRGEYGVPCVRGKIMSSPCDTIIDTGWLSSSVSITKSFYQQLLPQLKASRIREHKADGKFFLGRAGTTIISRVSSSYAGITSISSASVVTILSPPAQAILGYGFLRTRRITIDYPNKKVWFEGTSKN